MISSWRLGLILLGFATAMGSIGCGRGDMPDLGRVRGTVTMDGKPLANAVVMFQPDTGRPAMANTDSEGKYDLNYTDEVKGAKVGPNTVNVIWPDGAAGPVPIPEKYNAKSQLKMDVKSGKNTFDLKLESK